MSIGVVTGDDVSIVGIIQRVHALMPVFATERATGQRVLDDVVELAVTSVDLQLAVVKHIVGRTDAGTDLLGEVEADAGGSGTVRRKILAIEPDAGINRETIVDGPCVLNVDAFVVSSSDTASGVVIDVEVTVVATAMTGCRGTIFRTLAAMTASQAVAEVATDSPLHSRS